MGMLKRLLLLASFLLVSSSASIGFWDDAAECLENPCNCGYGTRYENWNGADQDKGDENPLCPPWNKDGGRHDNICLAGKPFPGVYSVSFQTICAEKSNSSTYFNPQIRMRTQTCNNVACWTSSDSLHWEGECKTLAGPYGLPLLRLCARIALPVDPIRDMPADPGYTPKEHLNFEGVTVADDPILDNDGNVLDIDPPKLCGYEDPSFYGTADNFLGIDIDVLDLDPNKQVFHKTTKVHPVVKVLIFFIDVASQTGTSLADLMGSLVNMMDDSEEGETTFAKILSSMFEGISWLIDAFSGLVVSALEEVGQINRVVSNKNYGCVNIPLGPYPPPFCPTVDPFFQVATIQRICETNSSDLPVESIASKECVVSTRKNNFIKNSVRTSFDNLIPLCRNGEDPLTTDKCVTIENMGALTTASALHIASAKRDVIPVCSPSTPGGAPCIKMNAPHTCSVTNHGCQDGYRIVYGVKLGDGVAPRTYYRDDLADCTGSSTLACQEIWGVNTGEFYDSLVSFPAIETYNNPWPLSRSFTLIDKEGRSNNFTSNISRVGGYSPTFNTSFTTKEICVFDTNGVLGCVERPEDHFISVYDCASGHAGISCNSTYFEPKLIASVHFGSDSTNAAVAPLNAYMSGTYLDYTSINMGGLDFDSFGTDDTDRLMPFSGPKSPTPSSIFGQYIDGASPLMPDGSANPDAVYIKDLEYVNGKYFRGGKRACLQQLEVEKCPDNTELCVLTNLQNRNVVYCSAFVSKSNQYQGLEYCTAAHTGRTLIDSIPAKSGGGNGVLIYSAAGGKTCYTANGGNPVCVITNDPNHRKTPSASLGPVIPTQYYDIDGSPGQAYNKDNFALRDKTAYEQNLCVNIPQPVCPATTENRANWPATPVGELATATCQSGNIPVGSMERYCLANSDTKTVAFQPLEPGDGCGTNVCPLITEFGAGWPESGPSLVVVGYCLPGYKRQIPVFPPQRPCLPSGGVLSWGVPYFICVPD